MKNFIKNIKPKLQGKLETNFSLAQYTWLKVGGEAEVFFQPQNKQELSNFLCELPKAIPITMFGHGSNLLIRDGGIEGVVIRLGGKEFSQFQQIDETHVKVGVALPDKQLALKMCEIGLGGFEFYAGIVGNVGGALSMNAGAHGGETKNCVVEIYALERSGKEITISNKEMQYEYRGNKGGKDLIFVSCLMRGVLEEKKIISEKIAAVQNHRQKHQPIKESTGGSTFRNPENHSAWKLIEKAGMRGAEIGGAKFSQMHCNFLINMGGASAYDFELLGELARKQVYEKTGVLLEWEIHRLGNFAKGKEVLPFSP